jgi:predicted amidohydrolase
MNDIKVTLASLKSLLADPAANLERVRSACATAARDGARLLVLPELMLTGHGGHARMAANAEPVPDGPLSREVVRLSREHGLCIACGVAERDRQVVYNSCFVVDRGEYLGLQRKLHMSGDEYLHFGVGESVATFDIGDLRFGVSICYDSLFPELALAHALHGVDAILAPHAARTGDWPDPLTPAFCRERIRRTQEQWALVNRARAYDHNVFVLLVNAVGSSMDGLDAPGVVANHAGTVMAIDPTGAVMRETGVDSFVDEIATVALSPTQRGINHAPTRNRRSLTMMRVLGEAVEGRGP